MLCIVRTDGEVVETDEIKVQGDSLGFYDRGLEAERVIPASTVLVIALHPDDAAFFQRILTITRR